MRMCSRSARCSWYSSHRRTVNNSALSSPPMNEKCCAEGCSICPDAGALPSEAVGPRLSPARPFSCCLSEGLANCRQTGPSGVPAGLCRWAQEGPAKGQREELLGRCAGGGCWAARWAHRDPPAAGRECPGAHMRSYLFTSQKETALAFSSGSWELPSKYLSNWQPNHWEPGKHWTKTFHKNRLKHNKKGLPRLDQVVEHSALHLASVELSGHRFSHLLRYSEKMVRWNQ